MASITPAAMLASPPISLPALVTAAPWRKMLGVLRIALGVLIVFVVMGNLVITAAWQLQSRRAAVTAPTIDGVDNLRVVDESVWRSAAPSKASYDELAGAGVRTIVDLRAEENVNVDVDHLAELGVRYLHLPIRDGQVPSPEQVQLFVHEVLQSDGITLVHCGAGVGRTGAMVAAYLVETGGATGRAAMRANLAVGPPSLEQLSFAANLDRRLGKPNALVVAASRVLDAPRRLWSRYGL